jgi:hypothetical protein
MIEYNLQINNGNEAFGVTGKTITANEVVKTISVDFLAEELHHANELIPKSVIKEVLSHFAEVSVRLMAEGFAIPFLNNQDVVLRLYPDIHLKCQSINLTKARELLNEPTLTEEQMVERAGEIADKVGVTVRTYAEVQRTFTQMLQDAKPSIQRKGIVEKAYVERVNGDGTGDDNGGDQPAGGGGTPSGELEG